MSFDACSCCGRRDGLTTGGCGHCSARTFCACGQLVSCGCGRAFPAHACPSVVFVGLFEPIPTMPPAESDLRE